MAENVEGILKTDTSVSIAQTADSSLLDETLVSVDIDQYENVYESKQIDSTSISSTASEKLTLHKSRSPSLLSYTTEIEHGVILKQLILKGISSQLSTAQVKLKSGEATTVAVSTWIGVGTKNGLVLVFDASQTLKWYLDTLPGQTNKEESSEWSNAISALAFNRDHTILLAGTAKGYIFEFDLKEGKLIRTLTDVHPPEAGILHLQFTDLSTVALLCDSGGNVFELQFKRTLGVRGVDTRCLFSGSRGEVCTMESLCVKGLSSGIVHGLHPKWESSVVVAMATLSKIFVVQIRPSTKVIYTQALNGDAFSPPCLAWHFVVIQSHHKGRTVEPVLAFGRQQQLHFYQLTVNDQQKLRCYPLLHFQLGFSLRALQWLDTRTLALLDSHRQLHVVDVKCRETVDVADISSIELVKSKPFFQGIATHGNVSQALALVGTEAYYCSFAACGSQVLLLGSNGIRSVGIRNWDERLDLLVSQSNHENALSLGLSMINGKAKAMQGLKGSPEYRRSVLKKKVVAILDDYIEQVVFPILRQGSNATGTKSRSLKDVVQVCVDVWIRLEEFNNLFDNFYPMICNAEEARNSFLERLEFHFLNDQLHTVPPLIMQQFVSHYEEIDRLDSLDTCLCHVDVSCLDLHQVLTVCLNHGLFQSYLYIHTRALNDYISPLEELFSQLQSAVKLGQPYSEQDIKLGHVLLVYISCCLAGRAYPRGEISEELKIKVKHQVFTCLTCLHTRRAVEDEPSYPYLRTLLEFNTQELLNVLSIAFEEPEFTGELGARQQQRIIDILVHIMINSSQFTPDQICSLFTFIARNISRNQHENIHLDRTLFQQLLDLVCTQSSADVGSHYEERQQALLQLMTLKGHPLLNPNDEEKFLHQAEAAGFYRVCEFIHQQREDWAKVLECYIIDSSRHSEVFTFLRYLFSEFHFLPDETLRIETVIINNLQLLVHLNASELVQLLSQNKPELINMAVDKLNENKQTQYAFLHNLMEQLPENSQLKSQIDHSLVEKYVELMAELEPELVASFIRSLETIENEKLVTICRSFSLAEATCCLLEREGKITEAYNVLLDHLKLRIEQLFGSNEETPDSKAWTEFHSATHIIIDFCQRYANSMSDTDREKIWLTLLDAILSPQRKAKTTQSTSNKMVFKGLQEVTQRLVSSAQGHLSLTTVLRRIIDDPETAGGTLGDLRQLAMGLLDNYNYETTLLRISTSLLQGDVHGLLLQRYRSSKRAISLRSSRCSLCKLALFSSHQERKSIAAFQCHHVFHCSCLAINSKLCLICHQIPITPDKSRTNGENEPSVMENDDSPHLTSVQVESVVNMRQVLRSPSFVNEMENSSLDESLKLHLSPPFQNNINED